MENLLKKIKELQEETGMDLKEVNIARLIEYIKKEIV